MLIVCSISVDHDGIDACIILGINVNLVFKSVVLGVKTWEYCSCLQFDSRLSGEDNEKWATPPGTDNVFWQKCMYEL